jgi:hypothetical protein
MSTARDLLDDLAMIGATVEPAGDRLILRAGLTAIPATLVNRVREAKADLMTSLVPVRTAICMSKRRSILPSRRITN